MNNKEKYKQAFSTLHTSNDFSLEVDKMKRTGKKLNKLVAGIAVFCLLLIGSTTVVYANDIGGIQRTIQLWIHGEQTDATIEFDGNGGYQMNFTDDEGNSKQTGGGGVAFDNNGNEIPLTEEELMEQITAPEVNYKDDGSVWVYWFDQKVDITDKFEDDICYVKLVNGDKTLYMTIKYKNGYSSSPKKYISPN